MVSQSVLNAYFETALWSTHDETGTALDARYSRDEIANESVAYQHKQVSQFVELAENSIPGLLDFYLADWIAHDFWLTRNGHGAGFWDGDYKKEHGEILTRLAKTFGEISPIVGVDGQLYFI